MYRFRDACRTGHQESRHETFNDTEGRHELSPIAFVQQHTYISLGALWFCSNIASSLPSPGPGSSPLYKFFYTFMGATFGMVPRLLATMWPGFAQTLGVSTLQTSTSRIASQTATKDNAE